MAEGFMLEIPEQVDQPVASAHHEAGFRARSAGGDPKADAQKIVGKTAPDHFRRDAR